MNTSLERLPKENVPEKTRSFSATGAFEDIRKGNVTDDVKKLNEYFSILNPETRTALAEHLEQTEQASKEFAERLVKDPSLLKRVAHIAQNFAEHGQSFTSLQSGEIYTELMDPRQDNIEKVLKISNPAEAFHHLKPLDKQEITAERFVGIRSAYKYEQDLAFKRELQQMLQTAFTEAQLGSIDSDESWQQATQNPKVLETLKQNPMLRKLYEAALNDRNIDNIDKSIEMLWRQNEKGERNPVMHLHQFAKNPETGHVSELGFDIEKEGNERILKNILIETDSTTRATNQGPAFLLSMLPLIKEYGLKKAEFIANIKIGSYAWAKITDVDMPSMLDQLSPSARKELGDGPLDEKKAKGLLMKERILPTYEKHMVVAIASIINAGANPEQIATLRGIMENEYEALKTKALAGEATMEDLASLGKDINVISFDKNGEIVAPNSPEATMTGHLGKASIMGIPWKARVPLDRASLFHIIDKLHKGTGVASAMKRAGYKVGLLFSL